MAGLIQQQSSYTFGIIREISARVIAYLEWQRTTDTGDTRGLHLITTEEDEFGKDGNIYGLVVDSAS